MAELQENTKGNVWKKEEPEPHKIFATITGLCLWRIVHFTARVEEGSVISFITETKRPR